MYCKEANCFICMLHHRKLAYILLFLSSSQQSVASDHTKSRFRFLFFLSLSLIMPPVPLDSHAPRGPCAWNNKHLLPKGCEFPEMPLTRKCIVCDTPSHHLCQNKWEMLLGLDDCSTPYCPTCHPGRAGGLGNDSDGTDEDMPDLGDMPDQSSDDDDFEAPTQPHTQHYPMAPPAPRPLRPINTLRTARRPFVASRPFYLSSDDEEEVQVVEPSSPPPQCCPWSHSLYYTGG